MKTSRIFARVTAMTLAAMLWSGCTSVIGDPEVVPEVSDREDPARFSIHAGFESDAAPTPASRTEMAEQGEDGTTGLVWNYGDAILLYSTTGGLLTGSPVIMTTQDDKAASAEFSATGTAPEGDIYFAGYPADRFAKYADGQLYATISSKQTAVAGNLSEGQHVAVAKTTSLEEHFSFKNVNSYISFKMHGAAEKGIVAVTLATDQVIAGNISITDSAIASETGETSTYKSSGYYAPNEYTKYGENASKVITLTRADNAVFEDGVTYHIALKPGTVNAITLRFEDECGRYYERTVNTSFEFKRSTVHSLGTFSIGELTAPVSHQLLRATRGQKPVTFVFLSQGFAEGNTGTNDRLEYDRATREEVDFIFSTAPFDAYKEYFNVYALYNAAETTVDANKGCWDSPFHVGGESFPSTNIEGRQAILDWVKGQCPDIVDGSHTINEVCILMLVNNRVATSGGTTHKPDTDGKDGAAISFVNYFVNKAGLGSAPQGTLATRYGNSPTFSEAKSVTATTSHVVDNNTLASLGYQPIINNDKTEYRNVVDWHHVMLHEGMGHALGRLVDDYWGSNLTTYSGEALTTEHNRTPANGLNASISPTQTPWDNFTAALANYGSGISQYERHDVFQGGYAKYIYGIWRPERVGCMMDNRKYFPHYERYLIVERIMSLSGAIDKTTGKAWSFEEFFKVDMATEGYKDPLRDN